VVVTRIGLFGGTFDPIHVGHLAVASAVAHGLRLDEVLFVVAHRPWQKVGTRQISDSGLRFAMVQAATADRDDLIACSLEIDRGGASYSIDTVEQLRVERPDAELILVVGSDVVGDLYTWHRHDELREMVTLGIVDRPGDVGVEPPPGWTAERIAAPLVDLSSSLLRARMAAGEPVDYLVPRAALDIYEQWHQDAAVSEESFL
jgi:nicotinate-nucleotide adenylyltransferase